MRTLKYEELESVNAGCPECAGMCNDTQTDEDNAITVILPPIQIFGSHTMY